MVNVMILENVFYILKFKTNILSLGRFDSQGCDISLRGGFLTLHDGQRRLLTKTIKTKGNMYLLKLNIVEHCLLVENNDEVWLCHRTMCHESSHTLQDMMSGNHAIKVPYSSKFKHKCICCVAGKHARLHFPHQLNLEPQSSQSWSMPTFVEQLHEKNKGRKALFAHY